MTFRARVTLVTSLVVAIALLGSSLVIYFAYRSDLMRHADRQLRTGLELLHRTNPPPVKKPTARRFVLPGSSTALVEHIDPAHLSRSVPAFGELRFSTETIDGVPTRRVAIVGSDPAISVTRSLADIDQSLSRLRWLLALTGLGAVAAASLLGAVVSGGAIAPLRRLTETTERIAASGELSERTNLHGQDEVSRLSVQLDALLASLEAALETQRQLVADASHELRTPIATLRANVGLLIRPDELDPHEREDLVADVQDELDSMTALVSELVELAHGEDIVGESGEFRLDELVQMIVDRAARRTKKVSFRTDLEPTTVVGVRERVERAVENLLDNARKWSPDGETIDVALKHGVIEVRDRGPGIAPEDAPLVFNRFYRSVRARGTPGAGLGLAIVKQVADAHNGSVTVADAPGGGTILRLSLAASR